MILNKEETLNLLEMLSSEDKDNSFIALKSINELNITDSLGYIILLFKFSKASTNDWKNECPLLWNMFINQHIVDEETMQMPTASKILRTMIAQDVKLEVIAMFLELHNKSLVDTLNAWGYNTDLLDVKIKLL